MEENEKSGFEAAVQAEVEKRMASYQAQFAQLMENTIKNGLAGIDQTNAKLVQEQKKVQKVLDLTKAEFAKAEKEGDKMAEAYFERSRHALLESSKKELIRDLTRRHLEAGRAVEDICLWLDVKKEYVESIIEVMDRVVDFKREQASKKRIRIDHSPKLFYENYGRGGTIWFENNLTRFDMWWEFGGYNTLVIIDIPTKYAWETRTKLPLDQRDDILRFIAEQVIEDQTSGIHDYEIGESSISIFR